MVQPREITYPIRLTTAELAFLLGTLGADTLLGGNDQALFPRDEAARREQWRQGREQLEAHGWLVWDAEAGHHRLSEELMTIVAAIADPQVVLLSEWESASRQKRGVAHYLSLDLVVEMTIVDDSYELVVLASTQVMGLRLAHSIGFSDAPPPQVSFVLSRQDVEQARRNPDPAWLRQRGLDQHAAERFAASLLRPAQYGTIKLLRANQGRAVAMRLVGVLVADDGSGWIATPEGNRQLLYVAADAATVEAALTSLSTELIALTLESAHSPQGS